MLTWLAQDLLVTGATPGITWMVAMFHHSPYSHGSHNSDVELQSIQMRTVSAARAC